MFKPTNFFKKDYDKLFKKDPIDANMLLLLCELANEKGEVIIHGNVNLKLKHLTNQRFKDPKEYQFGEQL